MEAEKEETARQRREAEKEEALRQSEDAAKEETKRRSVHTAPKTNPLENVSSDSVAPALNSEATQSGRDQTTSPFETSLSPILSASSQPQRKLDIQQGAKHTPSRSFEPAHGGTEQPPMSADLQSFLSQLVARVETLEHHLTIEQARREATEKALNSLMHFNPQVDPPMAKPSSWDKTSSLELD